MVNKLYFLKKENSICKISIARNKVLDMKYAGGDKIFE